MMLSETIQLICAALALVVGIILLAGFGLKKRQEKGGLMKILAYQSLGQKKGIAAVQVGKEVLVVAVTATDLKLLRTFNDGLDQPGAEKAPVADIAAKLRRLKEMKDTLYAVK